MKVLLFGSLAEIVGTDEVTLEGMSTTEELIRLFNQKYPQLASQIYRLAVNRKFVCGNISLISSDEIALMPPFSGG